MERLSPACRPVLLSEIARSFDVPVARLQRLVDRHRILPACRIGRTRCYGPRQIRRIYALLHPAQTAPQPAEAPA